MLCGAPASADDDDRAEELRVARVWCECEDEIKIVCLFVCVDCARILCVLVWVLIYFEDEYDLEDD